METNTKPLVFLSWLVSFFGQTLTGFSWRCPTSEMVSSDFGCYLFHAGALPFEQAESYCWSVGATLAWVESQDELLFIASQALYTPAVQAWLLGMKSLSNQKDLSTYYWTSGHKVTFTAWAEVEPDTFRNEKCVASELQYGYHWTTVPCHEGRSFICKSDPPFFRLKNPFLLGALGVVLILLIILVFVLCTMRRGSSSDCGDHMYCTENSGHNNKDRFILDHMPATAPPLDDRYTSLPHNRNIQPGDTSEHIYEDISEQQMACNKELHAEHHLTRNPPTNPYM